MAKSSSVATAEVGASVSAFVSTFFVAWFGVALGLEMRPCFVCIVSVRVICLSLLLMVCMIGFW